MGGLLKSRLEREEEVIVGTRIESVTYRSVSAIGMIMNNNSPHYHGQSENDYKNRPSGVRISTITVGVQSGGGDNDNGSYSAKRKSVEIG